MAGVIEFNFDKLQSLGGEINRSNEERREREGGGSDQEHAPGKLHTEHLLSG